MGVCIVYNVYHTYNTTMADYKVRTNIYFYGVYLYEEVYILLTSYHN